MQKICSDLSTELGKKVRVSRELLSVNLYVDRHSKSPQTELTAIADCLHATVATSNGEYTISRTRSDVLTTRKQIISERTKWIEEALRQLEANRKRLIPAVSSASLPGYIIQEFNRRVDEEVAATVEHSTMPARNPIAQLLPSQQLLTALLKRIGPQRLAESSIDSSCVFEDQPVAGNSDLAFHADLDDAYQKAMEPFSHAELPPRALNGNLTWENQIKRFAIGWGTQTRPISRIRIAETCLGGPLHFDLTGYDSLGKCVVSSTLTVQKPEGLQLETEPAFTTIGQPHPARVQLSAVGIEATAFSLQPLGRGLPEWFLHPDKHEPLNLFVAQVLGAISARHSDKCVVIYAGDSLWQAALRAYSVGGTDLASFEDQVEMWSPYRWRASADCVTWTPMDPFMQENCMADRRELSRFAAEVERTRNVGLRSIGRLYARSCSTPGLLPNTWEFYARVALGNWQSSGRNLTARMYRLIGAVSDNDWERLNSGVTASAGELGIVDELRNALGQEYGVVPEGRGVCPDLYMHPSELFVHDTYAQVGISVTPMTVPLIQDFRPDDKDSMWAPIFDQAGKAHIVKPIGVTFRDGQFHPSVTRLQYEDSMSHREFRLGHSDGCLIRISLPNELWIEMIPRASGHADTDAIAYGQLPTDLLDAFWQSAMKDVSLRIDQLRLSSHGDSKGQSQTGPPPHV